MTTCSMLLAGSVCENVGRKEAVGRPLSVVLKPADTEHCDTFGSDPAHLIRITLSDADSRALQDCLPGLWSWRWVSGGAATRAFLALLRETQRTPMIGQLVPVAESLGWDALAAMASVENDRADSPPAWLRRVRQELDDSASPPRLSELAARIEVHPVYLARQFRRFFGCSVSSYIHRVRVQRVAKLLSAGEVTLARAALAAGFSDQPHLTRIFRRETGVTPARFRSAVAEVAFVQDRGRAWV